MHPLQKIFSLFKQIISDNKGNISSTRIAMLIIVLWFLADWLMEFHSKGIYMSGASIFTRQGQKV